MNDSKYGLTASVWTTDEAAFEALVDKIDAGTVFSNRCDYLDPALAWTGVKHSGRGISLSKYGAFNRIRVIARSKPSMQVSTKSLARRASISNPALSSERRGASCSERVASSSERIVQMKNRIHTRNLTKRPNSSPGRCRSQLRRRAPLQQYPGLTKLIWLI